MSSTRSMVAWEAENHMVDNWLDAPEEARVRAEELLLEKIPVGIANHPSRGWVVLICQGHGPVIAWSATEIPL